MHLIFENMIYIMHFCLWKLEHALRQHRLIDGRQLVTGVRGLVIRRVARRLRTAGAAGVAALRTSAVLVTDLLQVLLVRNGKERRKE
jgi:hypothetical protein